MWAEVIDALHQVVERKLSEVNTNLPGVIVSYNAARNRAVVRPSMLKRLAEDDFLAPPQIVEVPVVWPASGGGNASFTMPLKPGDGVMLAFQQRSIENWLSGNNGMPDDPRQNDVSDCVAIAGMSSSGTVAHSDDVVLKFGGTEVRLKPDGSLIMGQGGAHISIDAGGNMVLKASSITIDAGGKMFNLEHHVHKDTQPGGGRSGEPFP